MRVNPPEPVRIVPCGHGGCMDCLRCGTHHAVNDVCLAARRQWDSRHADQPFYTYLKAYEDELLMLAVEGLLTLDPDPTLVLVPDLT